jgi:hypothetical protein
MLPSGQESGSTIRKLGIFQELCQSRQSRPFALADNRGADCIGHGEFAGWQHRAATVKALSGARR